MSVVKSVVFLLLQISLLNYVNTQRLSVALQKSYGTCNKNFCNISVVARPVNRTSKWNSMDIYFHKGVKLEAPIDVIFEITSNLTDYFILIKFFVLQFEVIAKKKNLELCTNSTCLDLRKNFVPPLI